MDPEPITNLDAKYAGLVICNQYRVKKVIGKGKQAKFVFLCVRELDNLEFAVKMIPLEKVG